MDTKVERVTATGAALEMVARLVERHGPVLLHVSGGCCDGSIPNCFPQAEFKVGQHDRLLGRVGGAPVYVGDALYAYWQHSHLAIDLLPGRGGMFSLESGEGMRFVIASRLFTDDEHAWLKANQPEGAPCGAG